MFANLVRTNTAIPPYPLFGPKTRSKRPTMVYPDNEISSMSSESQVSCKHKMSTFELRNRASISAFRNRNLQQLMLQTRTFSQKEICDTECIAGEGLTRKRRASASKTVAPCSLGMSVTTLQRLCEFGTSAGVPAKDTAPDLPGAPADGVKRCSSRRTIACKLRGPRRRSLIGGHRSTCKSCNGKNPSRPTWAGTYSLLNSEYLRAAPQPD